MPASRSIGGQLAQPPDFEKVRAALDTNLLGAWRCCAAAVPEMRKNGYRRIVNVSSHLGSLASMAGTNVSYRVSKAALNALTRVLAAELAGSGIPRQRLLPGADEYAHGVRRDRPDPGGWRGHAGMAGDPAGRRADRRVVR